MEQWQPPLCLWELGGYFGQAQNSWGTQSTNLESRAYLQAPFSLSGRKGGSIFRSRYINEKGSKFSSFFGLCDTSGTSWSNTQLTYLAQQLTCCIILTFPKDAPFSAFINEMLNYLLWCCTKWHQLQPLGCSFPKLGKTCASSSCSHEWPHGRTLLDCRKLEPKKNKVELLSRMTIAFCMLWCYLTSEVHYICPHPVGRETRSCGSLIII